MNDQSIYESIGKRTGGNIYIGVVGPVRTGKSTLIGRILETTVLPVIEDPYERDRALDEMPQSAAGRTVMTTEPKFVPDDAVHIRVADGTELRVKLVDCVGYLVDGALGTEENGAPRMVKTPWAEEEMPFAEAAEIGTRKVIDEHATVAILVTTDGSIADLPREAYIPAEERVARELSEKKKPFVIVLNSAKPESEEARALASAMEEKYRVPVALLDCLSLSAEDVGAMLGMLLDEFPIRAMRFALPAWCEVLPAEHPLRRAMTEAIDEYTDKVGKLGDVAGKLDTGCGIELISVDAGAGVCDFSLPVSREKFYEVMSEVCGLPIEDDRALFQTLSELSAMKKKYDKVARALEEVEEKGYGVVMPSREDLVFDEPKLVKQGNGYGVRIGARADAIHLIKTGMHTEFNPVVGTEEQSEDMMKYLREGIEEDPKKVFSSNMFGRSLYDIIGDGLNAKLQNIPDESREKLGETIEKIVNEGANGLICILV